MGLRTALGLKRKRDFEIAKAIEVPITLVPASEKTRRVSFDDIKSHYEAAKIDTGPKTWWITRLAMYQALDGVLWDQDGSTKTCLSISGSKTLGDIIGLKSAIYTEIDYPEANMLSLPYADDTFDFCISDQVLEHVEGDPVAAFKESLRVTKAGGYVCHTTCFINGIHQAPGDFWRFTPHSLKLMADLSEAETITVGGWGNRQVIDLMETEYRMCPIPDDPDHPIYKLAMKNEPNWPIVVWIICRKPVAKLV